MSNSTDSFAQQNASDSLKQLQSDEKNGLSSEQAEQRLEQYGLNQIREVEEGVIRRLLRRFWGPIPLMIEAAAILSASAQKWEDLIIILIMLVVNATLDFLQEHRALNALKVLKNKLESQSIVLRDGRYQPLASKYLVPGDII